MTTRKLLLLCLAFSVAYSLLFFVLDAFAINPGVGEGADLAPTSFRYRFGNDLDSLMPLFLMPFMPYLILRDRLGIPATPWDVILMPVTLFFLVGALALGGRFLSSSKGRINNAMGNDC